MISTIENALKRATADRDQGRAAWVPVFVDVVLAGEKIGHITSDGYRNLTWSFYPNLTGRRSLRDRPLDHVLPCWASGAEFENAKTYRERYQEKKS